MYLFLVVCSMYAYFVVAVETDPTRNGETTVQTLRLFSDIQGRPLHYEVDFFFQR